MDKRALRSLVKNLLPKYGYESEFHPRFIDAVIEKAIARLYNIVYERNPLSLQRFCKRFGGSGTPITVSKDINTNIYYSNYPTGYTIINFPDKASGVRRVSPKVQSGVVYYPMDEREVELASAGSYFDTVTAKIGYIVTPERIEYYGMDAVTAAAGVRLDLIIPFSQYADTDEVTVPEITDEEGKAFTDVVMEVMSIIKPSDFIDDNTKQDNKE
jgi:hypothetical protein